MHASATTPSALATLALVVLLPPVPARADGGTVRLLERTGRFVITVFSAPEPVRIGAADVSVMVQDQRTGAPVLDAQVAVEARPPAGIAAPVLGQQATRAQATNKLLYAAAFAPHEPGIWTLGVTVQHGVDAASVQCALPVAPARRGLASIWPYLALPPLVIALYALHAVLARRRDDARTPLDRTARRG